MKFRMLAQYPRKNWLCGCLIGLLAAAPASAQNAPVPRDEPPHAPGDVDLEHSRVFVKVGATGFGHEHGVEGRLTRGAVNLAVAPVPGQLVFDMKSFRGDTTVARKYVGLEGETDKSTADQVNTNMLGGAVLDVAKYPTAIFEIVSIKRLETDPRSKATNYRLVGKFTLHGVTRDVAFPAQAQAAGNMERLTGNFSILQSDYGIKPFSKMLGAIGVADELTIFGDLLLHTDASCAAAANDPRRKRR